MKYVLVLLPIFLCSCISKYEKIHLENIKKRTHSTFSPLPINGNKNNTQFNLDISNALPEQQSRKLRPNEWAGAENQKLSEHKEQENIKFRLERLRLEPEGGGLTNNFALDPNSPNEQPRIKPKAEVRHERMCGRPVPSQFPPVAKTHNNR